jgi:hypothetical protein
MTGVPFAGVERPELFFMGEFEPRSGNELSDRESFGPS